MASRSARRRRHKKLSRLQWRAHCFYKANDGLAKTANLLNDIRLKDPVTFIASVGLILDHWRREANFWAGQLGNESEKIPLVWDKKIILQREQFIKSLTYSKDVIENKKEQNLMIEESSELLRQAFSGQQPNCIKQLNFSRRYNMRS
jgi:hypothetical protein